MIVGDPSVYHEYRFDDPTSEVAYLRHLLCDVVEQHCEKMVDGRSVEGMLDSGFIRSNAEAIRYLCVHNFMDMIHDSGLQYRGVSAKEKSLETRGL